MGVFILPQDQKTLLPGGSIGYGRDTLLYLKAEKNASDFQIYRGSDGL
jgi:hypothetical protein